MFERYELKSDRFKKRNNFFKLRDDEFDLQTNLLRATCVSLDEFRNQRRFLKNSIYNDQALSTLQFDLKQAFNNRDYPKLDVLLFDLGYPFETLSTWIYNSIRDVDLKMIFFLEDILNETQRYAPISTTHIKAACDSKNYHLAKSIVNLYCSNPYTKPAQKEAAKSQLRSAFFFEDSYVKFLFFQAIPLPKDIRYTIAERMWELGAENPPGSVKTQVS